MLAPVAPHGSARMARVQQLEARAATVLDKMMDMAETPPDTMKPSVVHRLRGTTVKYSLDYFRYIRELERREEAPKDDDDLTALPTQDLEKIVRLGGKILGAERARELLA